MKEDMSHQLHTKASKYFYLKNSTTTLSCWQHTPLCKWRASEEKDKHQGALDRINRC